VPANRKTVPPPRDAATASLESPRSIVKDRDLLKPRMKITAYNQHDVGSSHEPWSCSSHTNLLATGQRRYAIKQAFLAQ
jgi:hypothetical protein